MWDFLVLLHSSHLESIVSYSYASNSRISYSIRNLGIGFGSASAGLFANIGGLADAGIKTNTAGKTVALIPEEIVNAIDLVHRVDIIIASTALIVTLIFYAQARKPEL